MKMDVHAVGDVTDSVRTFTLRHPRRAHLPAPTPGSHVDIHLASGQIRQYSLCGDPDNDTVYRIAVKREDDGRGASRWIHENLRVGDNIPVSAFGLGATLNNPASVLPYPSFNGTVAQSLRPYPQYSFINTAAYGENRGQLSYNALTAKLERRFHNGFNLLASYTWSKILTDTGNIIGGSLGGAYTANIQNPDNLKAEKAVSPEDTPQIFVISYIYDLPFGKNKAIGGNASGVLNQIIGNWQVAGITIATTGNWYTPTDISTNLSTSDGGGEVANASRPNVVGNPNGHPCVPGTLFNTCAFATNTVVGSFGDAGRNIIQGPGSQNWDISVFKLFPIREQIHLEFRAEFFNAFNHYGPEFDNPGSFNTNIATQHGLDETAAQTGCTNGSPNSNCAFGFAQAAHDPRFIQFALKFYF